MSQRPARWRRFLATQGLLLLLPGAKLLLHLATTGGYGYFRDELYYLASTDHLAWGYVDHPPLSIAILALWRSLFGSSLFALRFLPAVAGAVMVLLVGLLTRRLGGGRLAQALAMLSALVAPIYLSLDHIYSMNAFRLVVWVAAAYLVVRIVQSPNRGLWLLLGLLLGLGLLNKLSVLWLGAGLAVGFLATPARRHLATPGPWLATAVAAILFAPHVAWQVAHGWPTLEFLHNATTQKMVHVSPWRVLTGQVLSLQPATLPVWAAGLVFFFATRRGRPYRLLGWTWLTVFAIVAASGAARDDYLAPAATWLFAGGGVALEGLLQGAVRLAPAWRTTIGGLLLANLCVGGVLSAPLGLPLLSEERFVAYSRSLGVAPGTAEHHALAELPQFYADMHGWPQLVATVGRVFRSLPPEDRRRAAIFAGNYGEAGAIDVLGHRYGLPPALSGHNSYWLWGPRGASGEVVIVVGASREDLAPHFTSVERAATVHSRWAMPYENDLPIWVARGLRGRLAEVWPRLKHFE